MMYAGDEDCDDYVTSGREGGEYEQEYEGGVREEGADDEPPRRRGDRRGADGLAPVGPELRRGVRPEETSADGREEAVVRERGGSLAVERAQDNPADVMLANLRARAGDRGEELDARIVNELRKVAEWLDEPVPDNEDEEAT